MLTVNQTAPDFTLPDADGKTTSLHDFLGHKVVLYFYPKDSTPGCTREALAFKANNEALIKRGVTVIGVSRDSQASHRKFREANGLPFLLLSDPELTVIKAYGVWQEKKLYGKTSLGVVRTTFLIDEEGKIAKVYAPVKPDLNAGEILADLESNP